MRNKIPFIIVVMCFIVSFSQPAQTEMSSQSFVIPTSTVSSGGLPISSDSFDMVGTIGQPTPLGEQTSSSYANYSGYWYTTETGIVVDVCECDFLCDGNVDATDVDLFLIDFGRSTFFNPCTNADPCNGDVDCNVNVDAADVAIFLEDFGRSQFFNPCPACDPEVPWCVYP